MCHREWIVFDGGNEKPFILWRAHMRQGDFEAAWRISDGSRSLPVPSHLPRHLRPVWRGSPLSGKRVLIRCYRGLGDTIQFIRYAPRVKAIAPEVMVSAQNELVPLLRTMPAIDRVVELEEDCDPASWDVDLEVTELPYIFRTTLKSIPAEVPYFRVEPEPLGSGGEIAVGVVWAAGNWDPRRSVPRALFGQLADIPGVRLFSFQRGPEGQSLDLPIIAVDWRDILHEAGMLMGLDLLVSVDTMPAHLAGALGVPVWLLVHADPDWRWLEGRDDSPWYPSMRLFRQHRSGDWTAVLKRVASELRAMSAKQRG